MTNLNFNYFSADQIGGNWLQELDWNSANRQSRPRWPTRSLGSAEQGVHAADVEWHYRYKCRSQNARIRWPNVIRESAEKSVQSVEHKQYPLENNVEWKRRHERSRSLVNECRQHVCAHIQVVACLAWDACIRFAVVATATGALPPAGRPVSSANVETNKHGDSTALPIDKLTVAANVIEDQTRSSRLVVISHASQWS